MYEQEADRLAEHVMRMPEPQMQCSCHGACSNKRQTRHLDQEHKRLQTQRVGASDVGQSRVPPSVHDALRASGQRLDSSTRGFMEARFGHNFGEVRVHTDARAAESARAVHASAYAVGKDVVFGASQYRPATSEGRLLLAHELAHAVQQDGEMSQSPRLQRQEGDDVGADGGVGVETRPSELRFAEPEGAEVSAERGGLGPVIDVGGGVQVQLLTTAAVPQLPDWLPTDLRQQILDDELPTGVTRWPGQAPWGDLVIWVAGAGAVEHVEIYQEYPEDEAFHMELMEGNTYAAHVLTDVHTQYNRDMAYFVEGKGYAPHHAHNELRRINEEVYRLVIEAAGAVYASGFDLSAFRAVEMAMASKIVDAAERTGFTRRTGWSPDINAKAPAGAALPVPAPMAEKLQGGILSQAPPTRVVGDVLEGRQVVRKTVAVDTALGRTRFGKMWGAESIRAQESALKKLEAAGIDIARVRQSFSDTGELILDYAGRGVDEQWSAMDREAQEAYNSFVWHAKQEMGVLHDLKRRNIAYQRFESDGQVLHRFVVFDPAIDRYTLLVAIVVGVAMGTIGSVTVYGISQAIEKK